MIRHRGLLAVRSIVLLALSSVAGMPCAAAQTVANDRCVTADDEADLADESCHTSLAGQELSPDVSAQQQETCAGTRLAEIAARCPTPWVRFRLGVVEANLNHWVRAWTLLTDVLPAHEGPIEEVRRTIELDLLPRVRSHIVLVEPQTNVSGAHLEINGVNVGMLPLAHAIAVEPGELRLRVSALGFEPSAVTTRRSDGETFDERVVLAPVRAPTLASQPRAPTIRYLGYASLGVGVATALAGIGVWCATAIRQQDYQGARPGDGGDIGSYVRFGSSLEPSQRATWEGVCAAAEESGRDGADVVATRRLCDRESTLRTAAWAAGLVGAGLVAVGLTLVLVSRSTREPSMPRLVTTITPTYQGGVLSWNF